MSRFLLDAPAGAAPPSDGVRNSNFHSNMLIILVALLFALICVLGSHFLARCLVRISEFSTAGRPPHVDRKGLKKRLLRQLPVAEYSSVLEIGFTDCPICLGEFLDREKIRILPQCRHCFHVECVDIWLASHLSCPTCRRHLVVEPSDSGSDIVVVEVAGRQLGNAPSGHGDALAPTPAEDVG